MALPLAPAKGGRMRRPIILLALVLVAVISLMAAKW